MISNAEQLEQRLQRRPIEIVGAECFISWKGHPTSKMALHFCERNSRRVFTEQSHFDQYVRTLRAEYGESYGLSPMVSLVS